MIETLAYVDATWRRRSHAASTDPKARYALEVWLAPACYLERLAARMPTLKAHTLRKRAAELRSSAAESLDAGTLDGLEPVARTMAHDFQRSSSMVEGRNGQLSLRHHAFHTLSPLKRGVLTALHNYVITRDDGTTAAERFSGVKPEPLIGWLCARIKSLPACRPRREVRKAS